MTKIKDIGEIETLVDVQQSDSDSKLSYDIHWNKKTGYSCSCPSWANRQKKKDKDCKHIKRFRFEQQVTELLNSKEYYTANDILDIAKDMWKGVI